MLPADELDRIASTYCAEKRLHVVERAECTRPPGAFFVARQAVFIKAPYSAFFVDGTTGKVRSVSDAGTVMLYARQLGARDLSAVAEYVLRYSLPELAEMSTLARQKRKRWWQF